MHPNAQRNAYWLSMKCVLASDQSAVKSWLVQPIKKLCAAGRCARRGYALVRQLANDFVMVIAPLTLFPVQVLVLLLFFLTSVLLIFKAYRANSQASTHYYYHYYYINPYAKHIQTGQQALTHNLLYHHTTTSYQNVSQNAFVLSLFYFSFYTSAFCF